MAGLLLLLLLALLITLAVGTAAVVHVLTHPPRRSAGTQIARGLPTDPGELGYDWAEQAVPLADGTEIDLWIAEGGNPAGPNVVMLHGWGDGRLGELLWLELLGPLAAKVAMFDQRGHGESTTARCAWGAAERADAIAVTDHIRQSDADRPIVLFGYSMGGAIAIEAAAETEVAGVIADSPYRDAADAVRRFTLAQRLPPWPLLPLAIRALSWWCPPFVGHDTAETAARLRAPLLLLHGEADPVVPVDDARAIAQAAPHADLRIFADAGHLQAASLAPEEYHAAVQTYLHEIT